MQINFTKEASKLIVTPEGRIDTLTAPELEKKLCENLDGISELVINMDKIEYVSSAGLCVILKLQKRMIPSGNMKLVGVNEDVMEVFEITGFSDILNIE